MNGTMRI